MNDDFNDCFVSKSLLIFDDQGNLKNMITMQSKNQDKQLQNLVTLIN